jgi:hypothetical protein
MTAALLAAILGVLCVIVGLYMLLAISMRGRGSGGGLDAHRLMPTLAEDVLDEDLGRIYRRSLWLDAQLLSARESRVGDGSPGDTLSATTPSALGRAIRRLLVRTQAERFARRCGEAGGRSADPMNARMTHITKSKGEPPESETRLLMMSETLDEALAYDETAPDIGPALDALARRVDQAHRALVEKQTVGNTP